MFTKTFLVVSLECLSTQWLVKVDFKKVCKSSKYMDGEARIRPHEISKYKNIWILEEHLRKWSDFSKVASCMSLTPIKWNPHIWCWEIRIITAEKLCREAAYPKTHDLWKASKWLLVMINWDVNHHPTKLYITVFKEYNMKITVFKELLRRSSVYSKVANYRPAVLLKVNRTYMFLRDMDHKYSEMPWRNSLYKDRCIYQKFHDGCLRGGSRTQWNCQSV